MAHVWGSYVSGKLRESHVMLAAIKTIAATGTGTNENKGLKSEYLFWCRKY